MDHRYFPHNREELKVFVSVELDKQGEHADLNCIDTSAITDMSGLFADSFFNGDISGWDVSNVTDMSGMFRGSSFNGDISGWNVSQVKNMGGMFRESSFNGDISRWNVSAVQDMSFMFWESKFAKDTSGWSFNDSVDRKNMFSDSAGADWKKRDKIYRGLKITLKVCAIAYAVLLVPSFILWFCNLVTLVYFFSFLFWPLLFLVIFTIIVLLFVVALKGK